MTRNDCTRVCNTIRCSNKKDLRIKCSYGWGCSDNGICADGEKPMRTCSCSSESFNYEPKMKYSTQNLLKRPDLQTCVG